MEIPELSTYGFKYNIVHLQLSTLNLSLIAISHNPEG